jgi:hypothetical protein
MRRLCRDAATRAHAHVNALAVLHSVSTASQLTPSPPHRLLLQAVAINPRDASAQHLLGRWHAGVADMPYWKRQIASVVFATPPTVRGVGTT